MEGLPPQQQFLAPPLILYSVDLLICIIKKKCRVFITFADGTKYGRTNLEWTQDQEEHQTGGPLYYTIFLNSVVQNIFCGTLMKLKYSNVKSNVLESLRCDEQLFELCHLVMEDHGWHNPANSHEAIDLYISLSPLIRDLLI